jgi:hypothetical protein
MPADGPQSTSGRVFLRCGDSASIQPRPRRRLLAFPGRRATLNTLRRGPRCGTDAHRPAHLTSRWRASGTNGPKAISISRPAPSCGRTPMASPSATSSAGLTHGARGPRAGERARGRRSASARLGAETRAPSHGAPDALLSSRKTRIDALAAPFDRVAPTRRPRLHEDGAGRRPRGDCRRGPPRIAPTAVRRAAVPRPSQGSTPPLERARLGSRSGGQTFLKLRIKTQSDLVVFGPNVVGGLSRMDRPVVRSSRRRVARGWQRAGTARHGHEGR